MNVGGGGVAPTVAGSGPTGESGSFTVGGAGGSPKDTGGLGGVGGVGGVAAAAGAKLDDSEAPLLDDPARMGDSVGVPVPTAGGSISTRKYGLKSNLTSSSANMRAVSTDC